MKLDTSKVYRNLETSLKIAGIDIFDLLASLLFSGVMNLFFGESPLGIYFVFILPSIVLIILYFSKKNKPEGFLRHYLRWLILPEYLSAGKESKTSKKRKEKIYGR